MEYDGSFKYIFSIDLNVFMCSSIKFFVLLYINDFRSYNNQYFSYFLALKTKTLQGIKKHEMQ